MKQIFSGLALAGAIVAVSLTGLAQTNVAPAVSADDRMQATIVKHLRPIEAALKLEDTNKLDKVRGSFADFFKAQAAWHAQNDAQISPLWDEFNKAHGKKDDAATEAANDKITAVYATFKPAHDKFLADLSTVLSPDQIESVKDALTINKVKITFSAYGEIFHGLTEDQKAFILKELKAAREEGIDTPNIKEVSAFFKKHKNRIEAYLTAQGYDVKQSYKDFAAKQKAEAGGGNAAEPGAGK